MRLKLDTRRAEGLSLATDKRECMFLCPNGQLSHGPRNVSRGVHSVYLRYKLADMAAVEGTMTFKASPPLDASVYGTLFRFYIKKGFDRPVMRSAM